MNNPVPSSETLRKYLAGECSEAERRLVNDWYSNLDSGVRGTTSQGEEETLYTKIQSQIAESELDEHARGQSSVLWTYAIRAAAMLLMLLGLMYFFYSNSKPLPESRIAAQTDSITFHNLEKRVTRYLLPDSSQVWLKPGASLSYASAFARREIRFSGEGFFDVTPDKDRPFLIFSGDITTRVLGTTFNVRANAADETYIVSVVTGSVEVRSVDDQEKVILRPQQQMTFAPQSKSLVVKTIPEHKIAKEIWEEASLTFDEAPMSEVVKKLSATFQVKIEFQNPDIGKCRLKVDFNHQRLPEVLEMIDALLGTTYQMDENRIVIAGDGCINP